MLSPTINHNYAVKGPRERVDPGTPASSIRPRLINKKSDSRSAPFNTPRLSDLLHAVGDIRAPYRRMMRRSNDSVIEIVEMPFNDCHHDVPKAKPQSGLSRSRSLSKLKTKPRTRDGGMDFSDVFSNPLESPSAADEVACFPTTPVQSPTDSLAFHKPMRKTALRPTKSSNVLKPRPSTSLNQTAATPRAQNKQQRAQFPPRSSSFEYRAIQSAPRSLTRSRSQTVPQRRRTDAVYSIIPTRRIPDEQRRPSIADMPRLSFSSAMTISNDSSAQCSPMEASSNHHWSVTISDADHQSSTPASPTLDYSDVIRKQNMTSSMVTIPIMLDDPDDVIQDTSTANIVERHAQRQYIRPALVNVDSTTRSRSAFEIEVVRARSKSMARPPPSPIDKPLPYLPTCNVQVPTRHDSLPSLSPSGPIPPVPAVPAVLLPNTRRKIKSHSHAEQEVQSPSHKHSASSPDCFGSHFEWEDCATLMTRKAAERKTNLGQSCRHFLNKLSSSSIGNRAAS